MAITPMQVVDDGFVEELTAEEQAERLQAAAAGVVRHLEGMVSEQMSARVPIEDRWLRSLRQFHGIYEASVEVVLNSDPDRSKVFINMTRPKTNSWNARLRDLLFPADDKNYGISPTPVPELTDAAKEAEADMAARAAEARQAAEDNNRMVDAGAPDQEREQVLTRGMTAASAAADAGEAAAQAQRMVDEAAKRADAMELEIDDQFVESQYASRSRDALDDFTRLGIAVMKGPTTATRPSRRWTKGADGRHALSDERQPKPDYRRVDPWNFFPDMNATSMEDCEFVFERHLATAKRLRKMTKALGFDEAAVRALLVEKPKGFGPEESTNHLTQLRSMESNEAAGGITNRFIVWEYHGPLEVEQATDLLRGLGMDADADRLATEHDPLTELQVVCYFCSGKLLKLASDYPLDSGDLMYSVAPFERAESSILGAVGIPWLMRHEQSMLNSAVRMMIDNGGLSVGPQVVIDKTKIQPENGSWKLTPRKIWLATGQEVSGQSAPFQTYNIPVNQAQLAGIIELALKFTDEVVAMPMLAQGEQGGASQTMGGMSMLFSSANVVFRRVVKNWDDDMTAPTVRRAYDWNMQFSDKDAIKGDMQVEARGTSVLLVREIQAQQLMMIANQWSVHPVLGPAVKAYQAARLTLQAMAINPADVLVTQDEFEKNVRAAMESAGQQPPPEVVRAQTALEVAQINASSREAESQARLQIAGMNRETSIAELMMKENLGLKQIEATFAAVREKSASNERTLAAEMGAEMENKRDAEARGREPTGSGGAISLGTVPAGG